MSPLVLTWAFTEYEYLSVEWPYSGYDHAPGFMKFLGALKLYFFSVIWMSQYPNLRIKALTIPSA